MTRDPRKCTSAKALLEDGHSHAGFVVKEGGRFSTMRTRYLVLHKGCLYYFKDFKSTKEQGAFCILNYSVEEKNEDDEIYGIRLTCQSKRAFYFVVPTKEEQKTWISKLTEEINGIAGRSSRPGKESCSEPYDYAYQSSAFAATEELHNYEETDLPENNNTPMMKKTPYSAHVLREGKAPPIPTRCNKPNTIGNLASNKFLPQFNGMGEPCTFPRTVSQAQYKGSSYPTHNVKPKPVISQKPTIGNKPQIPVSAKPILKSAADIQADVFKLQKKLNSRTRRQESYEVQELKSRNEDPDKQDDSGSSDSEGYLELEGEGTDVFKNRIGLRKRPSGKSMKDENEEDYEKPVTSQSEKSESSILPRSVFQDSLSRQSSEDILRSVNKDGMYLIRPGRTGLQVITAYFGGTCYHYQIFKKKEELFLKEGEPCFKSLVDLVRHYHASNLPTHPDKLVQPYG